MKLKTKNRDASKPSRDVVFFLRLFQKSTNVRDFDLEGIIVWRWEIDDL